jgi:D-arabinose 1-dehydrogenase-like Zn-dependent alcohol dehydrogenase
MFCPERAMYARSNTDQGAFVSHAVWKAAFLFHIPDAITSSDVAPLMCAGAMVFNAMYLYNVRPTDRVGIVGVGGLGHIAIQFAAKMGCEVIVFSGSKSKREEVKCLGAREFYATRGANKLEIGKPIKHLFRESLIGICESYLEMFFFILMWFIDSSRFWHPMPLYTLSL